MSRFKESSIVQFFFQATLHTAKHFSNFIRDTQRLADFVRRQELQALTQDQPRLQFCKGPEGYRQKMQVLSGRFPGMAFGDIRRNGNRRALHLGTQSILARVAAWTSAERSAPPIPSPFARLSDHGSWKPRSSPRPLWPKVGTPLWGAPNPLWSNTLANTLRAQHVGVPF